MLLGFCHLRLCVTGALPFQINATGVMPSRLNADGVKPSQTLSYQGFAIPELCATEAMPSQIVCLDDLAVQK